MGVSQGLGKLPRQIDQIVVGQKTVRLDAIAQRSAAEELHREERALLVLAAIVTAVSDRTHLLRIAPMDTAPQVLVERVRETIRNLGYATPPRHSVHGYFVNGSYLDHLGESEPETAWDHLDAEQPGAFTLAVAAVNRAGALQI